MARKEKGSIFFDTSAKFYKGLYEQDVGKIIREGLKTLGHADLAAAYASGPWTHVTTDAVFAQQFGHYVLEFQAKRTLRILGMASPVELDVIRYLRKEFGHELFKIVDPRKVLPRNKEFTSRELVNFLRHQYQTMCKEFDRHERSFCLRKHDDPEARAEVFTAHYRLPFLRTTWDQMWHMFNTAYRRLLIHAQYDGYGEVSKPLIHRGIMMFHPEELAPRRVVWVDRDLGFPQAAHLRALIREHYGRLEFYKAP